MYILAIDTAAHLCAAAVLDCNTQSVIGRISIDIGKGHAEHLIDVVNQALERSQLELKEITRIAVNIGPGSFTGIRVGVATARGFAIANGSEIVPVTSLQAIAQGVRNTANGEFWVLLDARRGEIYTQPFDQSGNMVTPARVEPIQAFAKRIAGSKFQLAGSGARLVLEELGCDADVACDRSTPDIDDIARFGALQAPPFAAAVPLYLRGPDAKPQSGFALERQG